MKLCMMNQILKGMMCKQGNNYLLAKYVRRHHPADQIIGDKEARPMTRSRLRNETCLLSKMEPRTVNEALQDNDQYNVMK